MNASNTLKKLGIEQTFNYIYKDPDKNMKKLMDWADKFSKGDFPSQRKAIREAIENPEHPYYSYIRKISPILSNPDKIVSFWAERNKFKKAFFLSIHSSAIYVRQSTGDVKFPYF